MWVIGLDCRSTKFHQSDMYVMDQGIASFYIFTFISNYNKILLFASTHISFLSSHQIDDLLPQLVKVTVPWSIIVNN